MSEPGSAPAGSQARQAWFKVATVSFLVFLYLFSPFTQTFLGWFVDFEDNISHRVHELTFGALFAMIFVGVLLQLRDPARYHSGLLQAGVGAIVLTVVIATSTGWEWTSLLYVAPVAVIAWLHPERSSLLRLRPQPSQNLVILMLLITGPLMGEFLNEFGKAANEASGHQSHWGGMAAYALTILILGYLAAFRVRGWRVLALSTSLGVALIGIVSIGYDFDASASPLLPAILAVIWAAAFFVVSRGVETDPRLVMIETSDPPPPPPQLVRCPNCGALNDPSERDACRRCAEHLPLSLPTWKPAPPGRLRRVARPLRVGAGALGLLLVGALGDGIARDFTPPNVPHSIESSMSATCRACHVTGDQGAPEIDPRYHGDGSGSLVCSSCHGLPEVTPVGAFVDRDNATADIEAWPRLASSLSAGADVIEIINRFESTRTGS